MKKLLIASIIILVLAIIASFIIFYVSHKPILYSPKDLEKCSTLIYNGEGKLGITLFADKKTAEEYSSLILNTEPFKGKNAFNIYYIDSYTPECTLYKGMALLCYSKELLQKASSCPTDFIVAFQNENSEIRSSSYMNVMSLNKNDDKKVVLHEFGHALADFAEEYVPAGTPSGSKNCLDNCNKFNTSTCFRGCSDANYYRSEENGIMRTLASQTYGQFDIELLSNKLQSTQRTLTGNAINTQQDCTQNKYYLIEGNYTNNTMEIKSKTLESGCLGANGAGPFNYTLLLKDGSKIELGEFDSDIIFTDAPETTGNITGETYHYQGNFFLKVPDIPSADSLQISNGIPVAQISFKDRGARPCLIG